MRSIPACLRIFLENIALLSALASPFISPLHGQPSQLTAEGMVADENHIIVFTSTRCSGPYDKYQLMVSAEGGDSWRRSGPMLENGNQPALVFKANDKIWIVGENIAEGPAHDAFILISTGSPWRWRRRRLYAGPEELQDVAISKDGEILARIKHLKLQDTGWSGPVYLHRSRDGGVTWRVAGLSTRPFDLALPRFSQIKDFPHPRWRLIELRSGNGFLVQHRHDANLPWRTLGRFHAQPCTAESVRERK